MYFQLRRTSNFLPSCEWWLNLYVSLTYCLPYYFVFQLSKDYWRTIYAKTGIFINDVFALEAAKEASVDNIINVQKFAYFISWYFDVELPVLFVSPFGKDPKLEAMTDSIVLTTERGPGYADIMHNLIVSELSIAMCQNFFSVCVAKLSILQTK